MDSEARLRAKLTQLVFNEVDRDGSGTITDDEFGDLLEVSSEPGARHPLPLRHRMAFARARAPQALWGGGSLVNAPTPSPPPHTSHNTRPLPDAILICLNQHQGRVFPNPAMKVLNFSEKVSGRLIGSNGIEVLSFTAKTQIDLSGIARGTYILRLDNGAVSKIIKQ